jgi:hypothetical protein
VGLGCSIQEREREREEAREERKRPHSEEFFLAVMRTKYYLSDQVKNNENVEHAMRMGKRRGGET